MKNLYKLIYLFLFASVSCSVAKADLIQTFTLDATRAAGGYASGYINVDTTIGRITYIVLGLSFGDTNYAPRFLPPGQAAADQDGPNYYFFAGDLNQGSGSPYEDSVDIEFPTLTGNYLVGYAGGPAYGFFQVNGETYNFDFGALTPTPEPSSVILAGTGVLVGLVALRRKLSVSHKQAT